MNAEYEMAKLLKERDNDSGYSPVLGIVEQLPDIKIRLNEKVVLDTDGIASVIDLKRQTKDGSYVYLKKCVYMLPLSNMRKKYLVIGVDVL